MGKNNGGCRNGFNSRHRNGKSKLLKKTDFIPISFVNDSRGRKFLHCCIFSGHPSVLGAIKARSCIKKGCFYYTRFYHTEKSEIDY